MHATRLIEAAPPRVAAAYQSHTTGTPSFSHATPAGVFRCLVVIVHWDGSASDVSSVSYGGAPLTRDRTQLNTSPSPDRGVSIWHLVDPPEGAATVAVTMNGSTDHLRAAAISFQHVNPDHPVLATGGANGGATTTAQVTTASAARPCTAVGGYTSAENTYPATPAPPASPPVTERYDIDTGVNGIHIWGGDYSGTPASGNIPITLTIAASGYGWAMAAIALLGAPE